jgi:hypothetical protein
MSRGRNVETLYELIQNARGSINLRSRGIDVGGAEEIADALLDQVCVRPRPRLAHTSLTMCRRFTHLSISFV